MRISALCVLLWSSVAPRFSSPHPLADAVPRLVDGVAAGDVPDVSVERAAHGVEAAATIEFFANRSGGGAARVIAVERRATAAEGGTGDFKKALTKLIIGQLREGGVRRRGGRRVRCFRLRRRGRSGVARRRSRFGSRNRNWTDLVDVKRRLCGRGRSGRRGWRHGRERAAGGVAELVRLVRAVFRRNRVKRGSQ